MERFKGIYRIESSRLGDTDYARHGWCFVTICTKDREEYFGEVIDRKMALNEIGETAYRMYLDIPRHCKDTQLDAFTIMPNHIHGIIVLNGSAGGLWDDGECRNMSRNDDHCRDVACNVSTIRKTVDPLLSFHMSAISPRAGSLGSVVRSFKSAVSNWCHVNGHSNFAWQSRFYDHIIHDHHDLNIIRQYIVQNPCNWHHDENNMHEK